MPKPVLWAPEAVAEAELELRRRGYYNRPKGPQPMVQYQRDPIGFFVDVLGVPRHTIVWSENPGYEHHTWDGTPDPLVAVLTALAEGKNVAIQSATGVGKSFLAAGVVYWFDASWLQARVFTYAPKEDQLRKYMWMEMGKLWPKFKAQFPTATFNDLELYVDGRQTETKASWGASGVAVGVTVGEEVSSKAAGVHAPDMLLVTEETQGMEPSVIAAHDNTCTAPHNIRLALGNPNSMTDQLSALAKRPSWVCVTISAYDHPNVVCNDPSIVPGAVSRKSIDDRLEKYGDEQHPMFQSRVRGIPPAQSEHALFRREWIDKAIALGMAWKGKLAEQQWPGALGGDPSGSENGDAAGLAHFIGPICVYVEGRQVKTPTDFGRLLWQLRERLGVRPEHIGVDPIGVGSATVDYLRDACRLDPQFSNQSYVPQIAGSQAPFQRISKAGEGQGWVTDANLYANLRAQMYFQLRQDLMHGRIGLPNNETLIEEMLAHDFGEEPKSYVERKDLVQDKLPDRRSPNLCDAVVYANWVRPRTTPIDRGEQMPEDRSLGFTKVNGVMRPISPQDRQQDHAAPVRRPGVQPYWKR